MKSQPPYRPSTARFLVLLIFVFQRFAAQNVVHDGAIGLNIGVNLAFGTHFQRFGVNAQLIYINGGFQSNTVGRLYFSMKAPGPRRPYPELVISQGVVLAFGPQAEHIDPFFSQNSSQSGLSHNVAYSYNLYFNRVRTTQQTGIVSFCFYGFSLMAENDILARPTLDRFRTGALLLQYRYRDIFQGGIACALWTGQFGRKKTITGIRAFHNNCYMDTAGGRYTDVSLGMLSLQAAYNAGYGQVAQLSAGVDAEQVRNAMQNRFMHNMKFWPDRLQQTKNCHLPMLDENNAPFLYGENQKVRRPKPFVNVYANPNLFY